MLPAVIFVAAAMLPASVGPALSYPGREAALMEIMERLERWEITSALEALEALPGKEDPAISLLRGTLQFHAGAYEEALASFEESSPVSGPGGEGGIMVPLARSTLDLSRRLRPYESEHFTLFLDGDRDWVLAAPALEALEAAYERVGRWLEVFPEEKVRVEIIPTTEDFEAVSSLKKSEIETAGAVGICKFNKIMLLSPRLLLRGYSWLDSLVHEYLHYLLVKVTANKAPIWVQEGVARYGETLWRSGSSLYLQKREESLLARGLREESLVPFGKMDPSLVRLPTMEAVSLAFAECALAVDFLIRSWKEEGLHRFLEALSRGPRGGTDAALRNSIGLGMEDFEERWLVFLGEQDFREVRGLVVPDFRIRGGGGGEEEDGWDLRRWQPLESQRHVKLGDMLRKRERYRAGLKEYLKALEAAPASPFVINKVGRALLDLSRPVEAAERFREAIAIHPDYGTSYANLASALQETESWEEARVALERSLAINPFNPFVWKDLGYVEMQTGEREGAVRSWKTALRLNPGDPDLRRMLGEHP
jgi:tetratricopeptide (TPR) repeat protein